MEKGVSAGAAKFGSLMLLRGMISD
jgi:hypothetical protein